MGEVKKESEQDGIAIPKSYLLEIGLNEEDANVCMLLQSTGYRLHITIGERTIPMSLGRTIKDKPIIEISLIKKVYIKNKLLNG